MTLAQLLLAYKKIWWVFLLFGIFGGLLAAALFLLHPPKYIASGSFFVTRKLERTPLDFKYEGYYSSMSSFNYAKSFAALVESDDIKKRVLQDTDQNISRETLKKLDRAVKVKTTDTQLVTFQTKATTANDASALWQTYKRNLITVSNTVNKNGDANLVVTPLSSEPTVFQSFSNLLVTIVFGALSAILVSMFFAGVFFFIKDALHAPKVVQ